MEYKKLTLKTFKEKLTDGGYVSPTGARRAVGKCSDWPDATKTKARNEIDTWFGSAAGKRQSKKAPKKKTKKKTIKLSARKKGPAKKKVSSKKATKKTAKKAAGKSPLARQQSRNKTTKKKTKAKDKSSSDLFKSNPLAAINITATGVMEVGKLALEAMRFAKETYPDLDIAEGAQATQDAMTAAMKGVSAKAQEAFGSTNGTAKSDNGASVGTEAQQTAFDKAAPKTPPPPPSQSEATPPAGT